MKQGMWLYHCQRTVYKCTNPKISDFGFTIEAQQNIGRLDVSVYLHTQHCWPGMFGRLCWFYQSSLVAGVLFRI